MEQWNNGTNLKHLFSFITLMFIYLAAWSQDAPVTTAGRVTDAVPGNTSVPVPVTVTGFDDIGDFTLTLVFDTTRVRYVSSSPNPLLTGMTITYSVTPGYPEGNLVFAWTGAANTSLPDGSSIADLTFHYVAGTGMLVWVYSGEKICRYRRWVDGALTTLNDEPKTAYYLDGGVSNRGAPLTFAPVVANPVPGAMPLDITVNNFTTIGGINLKLEYDPAIITYQNTFTKNPAFTNGFIVSNINGNGGKKLIVISWYGGGSGGVTLASGSILCTLNFNYPSASCDASPLEWYDNGPSCAYSDNNGETLIDMPQASYYFDGLVAEGLYFTWTGTVSSDWDNASNWNACGIPDITRHVVIPNVPYPNAFPVLNVAGYCKDLRIETGATLTIGSSGSLTLGAE